MESEDRELLAAKFEALLDQSRHALRQGDAKICRDLAMSALQIAEGSKDFQGEAKAYLCLANADRMVARTRSAHDSSQRAAFLFQLCGDKTGEAEALSTLAYTFSILGRYEEAVEAALLSVKLNEQLTSGPALANSCTYLGIAYSHGGGYEDSDAALCRAIEILERDKSSVNSYFPRMHQRWMETIRVFYDRYFTGRLPSLERLRLLREGQTPPSIFSQDAVSLHTAHSGNQSVLFLRFLEGLEDCWLGKVKLASEDVAKAADEVFEYEDNPLFTIVEHWVRAEIDWATCDWDSAEHHATNLIELAVRAGNEQFVAIGYLLLSQLFSSQGKFLQAQEQQKLLRLRERLLRTEAIRSRAAIVEWQLKVRASHVDIQRIESEAKRLEKLSFEDALTGLPNRRRFEQHLPEMLRNGLERGMHPFVVFIDVDKFKTINDRFSHKIGDEVLKRVALILKAFVRGGDMPARIAGDEFVIALENVESSFFEFIGTRISAAVSGFDWASIHDGLSVSVSLGLSQAQVGDSVESLIHRSDMAMYVDKNSVARRA